MNIGGLSIQRDRVSPHVINYRFKKWVLFSGQYYVGIGKSGTGMYFILLLKWYHRTLFQWKIEDKQYHKQYSGITKLLRAIRDLQAQNL